MNTNSSNSSKRMLTIIFSILSLLMFNGTWVEFKSSYFLGSSSFGYTLFDITNLSEKMSRTFGGDGDFEFYVFLFTIIAYLAVGFLIAGLVSALISDKKNIPANIGASFASIVAVIFFLVVFGINELVREEIYAGAPDVLSITYRPILLLLFSVIAGFSSSETKNPKQQHNIVHNFCMNCGSHLPISATFCPACGTVVKSEDKLAALAKEKAVRENVEKTLRNGGWKCSKCNRINPSYIGTCACGNSKPTAEAKKHETDLETLKTVSEVKKQENIATPLKNDAWKCSKCNRINPSYIGTCACGNSKYD